MINYLIILLFMDCMVLSYWFYFWFYWLVMFCNWLRVCVDMVGEFVINVVSYIILG